MKISYLFTTLFCFTFLSLSLGFSQVTLEGRVVSEVEDRGLELANLKVFDQVDSSFVTGGLADDQGRFNLEVETGTYYLQTSYVGYEEQVFADVDVDGTQKVVDLGDLAMKTGGNATLDAVEIQAQGAQMELQLDKRIFRVDQDISLNASSADEILQNLPSVEVDAEGGVSLRGSGNVRILINGKPSGMVGIGGETDGLRNIPANLIERVEVITNPSARYDAEGEVGIINIILKKEQRPGFNGSFNVSTGYPQNHRLGANLNYRSGKVNFFVNVSGDYRDSPGGGGYYQELKENGETYLITDQQNDRSRASLGGNLRAGADWTINDWNTLTFSGLVGYDDEVNRTNITYRDFTPEMELIEETTRNQIENESDENVEFQLNHRKTFPIENHEWTSSIQYQLNNDTELADITEQVLGYGDPLLQRSSNTEDEAQWLIQSDYVHPFGPEDKLRFETGTRITLRTINNNYLVEEKQPAEALFQTLPNFNNDFLYQENIYAAYGIFSQEIQRFAYQVGLRAEYSDIGADTLAENMYDNVIRKQYLNWFPSAFLSYKLNGRNTLQLSYSRRLSRPRFRNLMPFSSFSDRRNLRVGNPDLDPEYTNSMELGYLAYWDKGSLLSSIYYRNRTGVIERITTLDEDGTSFRIPVNLSTQNAVGFELSGSQDITSWWNISGNLNFYGFRTEGTYQEQDYYAQSLAFQTRVNSRMTVWDNARLQISGNYRAPQRDPQGYRKAFYSMDLGFSKPVIQGKGTLTLSVRDVFNTRKWRGVIDQEDFYRESEFQWRRRQITLNFTYRLNQEDRSRDGERGERGRFGGEGFDGGAGDFK